MSEIDITVPVPSILIIGNVDYWHAGKGMNTRIGELIRSLSTQHRVCYFYYGGPPLPPVREQAISDGPEIIHAHHRYSLRLQFDTAWKLFRFYLIRLFYPFSRLPLSGAIARRLLAMIDLVFRRFGRLEEYRVHNFQSRALEGEVYRIARSRQWRFVLVEYLTSSFLLPAIRHALPKTPVLLDTHDVHSLRLLYHRRRKLPHWLRISPDEERSICSRYDAVLAISRQDQLLFERLLDGATPTLLLPPSLPALPPTHPDTTPIRFVFVGMSMQANFDGITWFLQSIWPEIVDRMGSKVHLHIVGTICLWLNRSPPHTTLHGFVPDISAILDPCMVSIVPIHSGGGIQIKMLEAMSRGMVVVSTSFGLRGFDAEARKCCLVPGDEQSWIDICCSIATNPETYRALARSAREYFARFAAPGNAIAALEAFVDDFDHPQRPPVLSQNASA